MRVRPDGFRWLQPSWRIDSSGRSSVIADAFCHARHTIAVTFAEPHSRNSNANSFANRCCDHADSDPYAFTDAISNADCVSRDTSTHFYADAHSDADSNFADTNAFACTCHAHGHANADAGLSRCLEDSRERDLARGERASSCEIDNRFALGDGRP